MSLRGLMVLLVGLCTPVCVLAAVTPPPSEVTALHVLNRLGYGPAPGDLQRVLKLGVDAYIHEQLHPETIAQPPALLAQLAALESLTRTPADLFTRLSWPAIAKVANDPGAILQLQQEQDRVRLEAAQARLLYAIYSRAQLQEMLVDFWFNHFNVFADRGQETRIWLWSYERDAIRPYALGKFRDLLGATARHPAMLYYLDNWLSKAPTGKPGEPSGLNENYAREVMELHTLGVDGGYTQKDVTELARILTGWTYRVRDLERGDDPAFYFDIAGHDRGAKTFLGRKFAAGGGLEEGEQALDMLARSPVTAHRIAYQLAQYFVADEPPPALVKRLTERYLKTGGDIRKLLDTLFASREFRASAAVGSKFKTPLQYVVSTVRASGVPQISDFRPLLEVLSASGEPLYGCLTPDGYKDTRAAWFNPDAFLYRLNFASGFAMGLVPLWHNTVVGPQPDANALQATMGAAFTPNTLQAVAQADAGLRAGLLLASPEFMQR